MAVPSVFVSSVVGGLEDVRAAAAVAVRKLGMHPILSENAAAAPEPPRRALLDQVAGADYYLLLLGARYGEPGAGGKSPTEDEYDHAVKNGVPIVPLLQEGELEPDQREFVERVRGSWGDGVLSGRFRDSEDVGVHVAAALARIQAGIVEDAPRAQARALELARGESRSGYSTSGIAGRVALVPLRDTILLDALALEDVTLVDGLINDLRAADAISQRLGVKPYVSSGGVTLRSGDTDSWVSPGAEVGSDGSITVTGSVAVEDGSFGLQTIDPEALRNLILNAARFAQKAWDRIDRQAEVGRVSIAVAIPEAQHIGFGRVSGTSVTMSMSMPDAVVVPARPPVVARAQLAEDRIAQRLVAEIRRVFADAGAAQD